MTSKKSDEEQIGTLNLPFPLLNPQPAIARGSDPDPFRTRKSNLSSLLNTDLRERLESSSAGVPLGCQIWNICPLCKLGFGFLAKVNEFKKIPNVLSDPAY